MDYLKFKILENYNIDELLHDQNNIYDLKTIQCGTSAKKALENIPDSSQLIFLNQVKSFSVASTTYLIKKVQNLNLDLLECVSPYKIKDDASVGSIVKISKLLPIKSIDENTLSVEWRLIQLDEDIVFPSPENNYQRIDTFWSKIFLLCNGSKLRYPVTTVTVKAVLSLVHGSAGVERGFSVSANILSDDRANMAERTLNSQLSISDGLKTFENKIHEVPITSELIKLARNAHRSYQLYLEEERRKKAEELQKKEKDQELIRKEREKAKSLEKAKQTMKVLETKLSDAEKEFEEAAADTESLMLVLKNSATKNCSSQVLGELVRGVEKLRDKEKEKLKTVKKYQKDLSSKKNKVIQGRVEKNTKKR